jgi:trypsin
MKFFVAFVALVVCANAEVATYFRPHLFKNKAELTRRIPQPLIVGGNPANDGDFPYQLGLLLNGNFRCGGSIISTSWILSAAHCLDGGQPAAQVTWHGGSVDRHSGGTIFTTAEYTLHPSYSRITLNNDVLVARSNQPLTGAHIGPVAMATLNQNTPDNAPTVVTGWGLTAPGGSLADILQEVTVPIIPQGSCGSSLLITAK